MEFGPSAGSPASPPPLSWSMMRSNEDRRTGKDSERVSSRAARRSALPTPCACGGRCDDSHGAGARGPVTCDWSWLGGHCTASPSGACKAATASRALLNLSNESRRGGNELQRSLPLSSAEGSSGACGGVVAGERGIAQVRTARRPRAPPVEGEGTTARRPWRVRAPGRCGSGEEGTRRVKGKPCQVTVFP